MEAPLVAYFSAPQHARSLLAMPLPAAHVGGAAQDSLATTTTSIGTSATDISMQCTIPRDHSRRASHNKGAAK